MKISFLFKLAIVLLLPFSAGAKGINLTVAPVGLFEQTTRLGAEFAVFRNLTLGVRYTNIGGSQGDVDVDGETWGAMARFYLTRDALEGGFYFMPGIDYTNFKLSAKRGNNSGSTNFDKPVYSMTGGYQFMWDHINFNLGLGFSYTNSEKSVAVRRENGDLEYVKAPDLLPGSELSIGWAF